MNRAVAAAGLLLVIGQGMAATAQTTVTNADICARMDRETRLGDMTAAQCTCFLGQGDRHIDSALARLWKEALFTGQSRMAEVAALGIGEARMERQMRRTLRDARRSCGVSNTFGF